MTTTTTTAAASTPPKDEQKPSNESLKEGEKGEEAYTLVDGKEGGAGAVAIWQSRDGEGGGHGRVEVENERE